MFHVEQPEAEARLRQYERILAGPGIERGLLGPRERDRLWQRHIGNCAVVAEHREVVPEGVSVIDVGSGAGLPGVVWALVRPDLHVTLVESLLRRTAFLTEAVAELGLKARVAVLRARAEELTDVRSDIVTARAVAPLPRLLTWARPLAREGGHLVLFKGRTAAAEMAQAAPTAKRLGLEPGELWTLGGDADEPQATVVRYAVGS